MAAPNGNHTIAAADGIRTYTILEADGQYPDNELEETIFAPQPGQDYRVRFIRTALAPVGVDYLKPYSEIPKEIRDEVDGLMVSN